MQISDAVLDRVEQMMRRRMLTPFGADPDQSKTFALPKPAPGVIPNGAGLAMDEAFGGLYADAEYLGPVTEGIGFPGYPYLAELMQRAEYRRPCEILAKDMTRRGLTIKSVGDQDKTDVIRRINDEFERLNVMSVLSDVILQDSIFGRSQIYLDQGIDDPDELKTPLAITKAKIGPERPLKRLGVIEAMWTYPSAFNATMPWKPDFYIPSSWYVMGCEFHASRLITIVTRKVPDILKPAYMFGGLSLLQLCKPTVDNWLRTRQSVSDAISNFSIMVMLIDLGQRLQQTGPESVWNRLNLFNLMRDNGGVMVADKASEDLKNVSMPISGLDHLQAQAQEHMSSCTGIPLVKLTGISPSGLNATSEFELISYNDWIAAQQQADLDGPVWAILKAVQLSLFAEIDPTITFEWNPLGETSELDRATIQASRAQTDAAYVGANVLAPEEVRKRIAADPNSGYSNLDVDDDDGDGIADTVEGIDAAMDAMPTR